MSIVKTNMNSLVGVSALILAACTVVSSLSVKARVGKFFIYPIHREDYFPGSLLLPSSPVEFQPFVKGEVMLPHWMTFLQADDTSDAYLYGLPEAKANDKVNLQVVGLNMDSYQAKKENVIIELYEKQVSLTYYIDLPLVNMTLEQLLEGDTLSTLTHIVQRLWTRGEVMPTRVVPPEPPSNSVLTVRFSGTKHFSTNLRMLATHPSSEECQRSERPKVKVERDFSPRFMVDWCRVVMMEGVKTPDREITGVPAGDSSPFAWSLVDDYDPPSAVHGRVHSLFQDFLACVLIPVGVLILLVLVLACVMCCGRTGWEKRVKMTPEPQLVRYNSIRRASISLRQLSENRELALSSASRSTSMNVGPTAGGLSDGEPENTPRSAPGTLQRKREGSPNAPPPYRPPLGYGTYPKRQEAS
ncbi:epsilon-sarcoglycan-like [Liolophura sinensis]|uniref:epsilon-sarcoglycan-like n=1 Tax=Liolophura sinensis TaxID=3198878 RepID=UPI003158294B